MKNLFRYIYRWISKWLSQRSFHLVKSLPYLKRERRLSLERLDYIRLSSLELAAEEIYTQSVAGNVAELGVYQGDFAVEINLLFNDRKFYLFDTFEGFDAKDKNTELGNSYSSAAQNFSDTSAEFVLNRMPLKQNCIIKKGFFPDSAKGVEDIFCFVSIDTDLYDPIYSGLHFFYPKLSKGGYIFIHDFNNDEYKGAREAVRKFCKEQNIGYTLIADAGGSAIISK